MEDRKNNSNCQSFRFGGFILRLPPMFASLGDKLRKWYHTSGVNGYVPKVDINSLRMEDE
jgi:hypothetical protein